MESNRQSCASCAYFGTTPPAGRMPGVTDWHRRCLRPRVSTDRKEWRAPGDWCQHWTERKPGRQADGE